MINTVSSEHFTHTVLLASLLRGLAFVFSTPLHLGLLQNILKL